MHIKEVIIEGFKTYKDRTVIELDSQLNIVVGRNGSAIQFVLSDKYSGIRADSRQNLLHEGTGRNVMSAYVELVFDNSDGRIPGHDKLVHLKRSIGVKKDEFFLNSVHATKQEVDSLLESAGLSRSNPYYIVQQGKVAHLIKMHESERLELLKEIAGTRVYDDRRKESSRIMVETSRRYVEIMDILDGIDKRLAELDEEKEVLAEFQQLDRDRRCLEFTMYDQDLQKAMTLLDEIEQRRIALNEKTQETHGTTLDLSASIANVSSTLSSLQVSLATLSADHSRTTNDLSRLTQKKTTLELQLSDAEDTDKTRASTFKQYRSELKSVLKQIKESQSKLELLTGPYEELKGKEEAMKNDLESKQAKVQNMYSKQSRASKHRNKSERDTAISAELTHFEKIVKTSQKDVASLTKEVSNSETELNSNTSELSSLESQLVTLQHQIEEQHPRLEQIKQSRDQLINSRKDCWRKDAEIESSIRTKTDELRKAEQNLSSTLNKGTSSGLKVLETILTERSIPGVRGPLIDLIECDEKFNKCVETVAANRLFQIVVDNDDTVSELLKKMKSHKQGRLTFMPLNRLTRESFDYPESKEHVIPLISQLRYDPKYKDAVNQVFGRTLVARSLQLASEYSHKLDFDCITLDGDQVNRKGAYSGGYIDSRKSRLESHQLIKTLKQDLLDLNERSRDIKSQIDLKEQELAQVYTALQKEEQLRGTQRNEVSQMRLAIEICRGKISSAKETFESKSALLTKSKHSLDELNLKILAFKDELKSPFSSTLSSAEVAEIDTLNESISDLQNQLVVTTTEKSKLEIEVRNLQNLLSNNLSKREIELNNLLNTETSVLDLEDLRRELNHVNEECNDVQEKLKEIDTSKDDLSEKISTTQVELDRLKSTEQERKLHLSTELNQIEKLHSKRSVLENGKDECVRKIRELGAMPTQAHSPENLSPATVRNRLDSCLSALKKFSSVNRKAIDQYLQFNEKRIELLARREELDKGKKAIEDLIQHLDQQKDEAISRTFKGIAKHFTSVFKKLVPDGRGSLVILKGKNSDEGDDGEDEQDEGESGVIRYTGVGIRVSFTGVQTVTSMTQLSGGQQTVVALALLFAIQLCDPSPFYFFDEIDAALDPSYRTAIANMLSEQKNATQFIVTTFRPEILHVADKYFKVEYTNRISIPSEIDVDEAASVIAEIENDMERDRAKQ